MPSCGLREGPAAKGALPASSLFAAGLLLGCSAKSDPSRTAMAEPLKAAASKPAESVPVPPAASAPAAPRPAAEDGDAPRVFAKTRFVWIRERPEWASQWLGYLWPGESTKLRSPRPIYARGCDAWYAVEPRGYVCVDGRRATLDRSDPEVAELARLPLTEPPDTRRFAESLGAEHYDRLPERAAQRAREPDLERHLALVESARSGGTRDASLAGVDLAPARRTAEPFALMPVDLQVQRKNFRRNSTLAFLDEYSYEGRSYLLTTDLSWVPKDRVRPFDSVTFRGARLDHEVRLPIAFFREHARPAFERAPDGAFVASARKFARLAYVELTGTTEVTGATRYLETREAGLWVLESDCVLPTPSEHTPWGARVETTGAVTGGAAHERKTWIESSVYGGWLIAYENTRPVFATLVSSGRGGGKSPDAKDLLVTSSTPFGTFPVTGKFVTATMDGPDEIVHSDVPWVQNFRSAHAIHSAYWHDAWGERMSGGCINVSPADGRFLFEFTEPALPEGWHGVRWDPRLGPSTIVVVHR
jgi:hypothetical protein